MIVFNKIADLRSYLQQQTEDNKTIGFVPTMGALHEGPPLIGTQS